MQVLGATILGEIGDIHKFSNPKKLVAYAGIDASVTQSGEYLATHNVMSKRGSPYLRKALFQAALIASRHDPVLKAFYDKKRAEGKHHLTALGAVSRKLCYIIHAILTKNEPYEIRQWVKKIIISEAYLLCTYLLQLLSLISKHSEFWFCFSLDFI